MHPSPEHARFCALWTRCLQKTATPEAVAALADGLIAHYHEPHRRYHTLGHVKHCLQQFDEIASLTHDPDAVEMALWFHDAIYQPGADDNELRSAELFRKWSDGGMPEAFRQRVHDLIMATTHRQTHYTGDAGFVVDIDLSGFGSPWPLCERDGKNVRAEFPHLTDAAYYPTHVRFLQALQERPTFFFTEALEARYGAVARENVARSIADAHACLRADAHVTQGN